MLKTNIIDNEIRNIDKLYCYPRRAVIFVVQTKEIHHRELEFPILSICQMLRNETNNETNCSRRILSTANEILKQRKTYRCDDNQKIKTTFIFTINRYDNKLEIEPIKNEQHVITYICERGIIDSYQINNTNQFLHREHNLSVPCQACDRFIDYVMTNGKH